MTAVPSFTRVVPAFPDTALLPQPPARDRRRHSASQW